MNLAPTPWLFSILLLAASQAACSPVQSASPPNTRSHPAVAATTGQAQATQAVHIFTPTGWWLIIKNDGAGRIGYGSTFGDDAPFPSGTFDWPHVRDALVSNLRTTGSISSDFGVTWEHTPPEDVSFSQYTANKPLMRELFEKAKSHISRPMLSGKLNTLWHERPPVPKE